MVVERVKFGRSKLEISLAFVSVVFDVATVSTGRSWGCRRRGIGISLRRASVCQREESVYTLAC
jgi:hypothetical protein